MLPIRWNVVTMYIIAFIILITLFQGLTGCVAPSAPHGFTVTDEVSAPLPGMHVSDEATGKWLRYDRPVSP